MEGLDPSVDADTTGSAPPGRPRRLRRLWARYHRIVRWVLVVKALFGLSYTLLIPTYRGPDEALHVDMVLWYQSHAGYANPKAPPPRSAGVVVSERLMGPGGVPRPPQHMSEAVPRPDRQSFDELALLRDRPTGANHMSQHPPLYYTSEAAAAALTSIVPEEFWSWDRQVYVYRLITWLSVLTLPLLAAGVALALGLARASTAVAASVTLVIPGSTFIGAVVNNDGLAAPSLRP